jgi:hypothetical protein
VYHRKLAPSWPGGARTLYGARSSLACLKAAALLARELGLLAPACQSKQRRKTNLEKIKKSLQEAAGPIRVT